MDQAFMEGFAGYERNHPGITEQIWRFMQKTNPVCELCGSVDTAEVQIGVIGRTLAIQSATTRVKFIPWGPPPGQFFCNTCRGYFTPASWYGPIQRGEGA